MPPSALFQRASSSLATNRFVGSAACILPERPGRRPWRAGPLRRSCWKTHFLFGSSNDNDRLRVAPLFSAHAVRDRRPRYVGGQATQGYRLHQCHGRRDGSGRLAEEGVPFVKDEIKYLTNVTRRLVRTASDTWLRRKLKHSCVRRLAVAAVLWDMAMCRMCRPL